MKALKILLWIAFALMILTPIGGYFSESVFFIVTIISVFIAALTVTIITSVNKRRSGIKSSSRSRPLMQETKDHMRSYHKDWAEPMAKSFFDPDRYD